MPKQDSNKKKRAEDLVSPPGKAVFPWLNVPDTKYKKTGEYSTGLEFPINDPLALELKKLIEKKHEEWEQSDEVKAYKENVAEEDAAKRKQTKGKNGVYEQVNFPFSENEEEGTIRFNFKMNAQYEDKKTKLPKKLKPMLVDSELQPLRASLKVGGGSTIIVSFQMFPYVSPGTGYGVSLRMNAVQVLELKQNGVDAAALGFTKRDGFKDDGSVDDSGDASDDSDSQDDDSTPDGKPDTSGGDAF